MPKARYQKDKEGLYYVYVPTGKIRKDGYAEFKKLKAKTQAALDEKKTEYEANYKLGVVTNNKLTVDQWYEQWILKYKSSTAENTQNYYKNLYTVHIKPVLGPLPLQKVREIDAQGILSKMAETHAESTVKGARKVLFGLFDTAVRNKLISVNPCVNLAAAGRKKKERRALTLEERKAYLRQCEEDPFGAFAVLIYFFGLRRGEALALTGADVFPDHIVVNKQVTYPGNNAPVLKLMPKTDAGFREIPIPDKARQYIDFDALPDGLLIPGPDGKPLTYSPMIDAWNAFLKKALGAESDITIHCLRHNYCTMLFEQGVDPMTVKNFTGHEDIETTLKIYTHYTESLQKKGTKKALKIG